MNIHIHVLKPHFKWYPLVTADRNHFWMLLWTVCLL